MRKLFLIIGLFSSIIFVSCDDSNGNKPEFEIGIDVQSDFNQDQIQIWIDDVEILNEKVETDRMLGVCHLKSQIAEKMNLRKVHHQIKILINSIVSTEQDFYLKRNLYIGVNYNQQFKKNNLVYSKFRFAYD